MLHGPVLDADEYRRIAALDRAIALSQVLGLQNEAQVITAAQAFEFYLTNRTPPSNEQASILAGGQWGKQAIDAAMPAHDGDAHGGRFVQPDAGFDNDVSWKGGVDA